MGTAHAHSRAVSRPHGDVIACHVVHGDGVCGVGCDRSEGRARG